MKKNKIKRIKSPRRRVGAKKKINKKYMTIAVKNNSRATVAAFKKALRHAGYLPHQQIKFDVADQKITISSEPAPKLRAGTLRDLRKISQDVKMGKNISRGFTKANDAVGYLTRPE